MPAIGNMRLSLSYKVIGIIVVVSVVAFFVYSYIHLQRSRDLLETSYVERGKTIAYALDANIEDKEDLEDESSLLSEIHKYVWLNPDILEINVNIPQGDSLVTYVSNNPDEIDQVSDIDNSDSYRNDTLITKIIEVNDQRILRVITPIHIAKLQEGTYQIDLTLEEADKAIIGNLHAELRHSLLIMLPLILFLYLFLRFVVVKPISEMSKGVESIAKGDLDYRVSARSNDEIGQLASAFNQMTQDLKVSRAQLEKHSEDLERQVGERTSDLMEANEELSREIAERKRAEEERQRIEQQLLLSGRLAAVGELAAGVAHELNNPLAAVQGYAQFLTMRQDLDESMRSDVDTIYEQAQRASRITANLLQFARKHEPERSSICINNVIENCVDLHAYRMKVNNIEVSTDLDHELPDSMADFHQLQQVFVNLITNAEHAMTKAHGKGMISIKTHRSDEAIRITVADNGPGIPEEDLARIFDPFFTTKEVGQGTGLGLSICFGIVEQHSGTIRVESELGKGATFIVELPIVTADEAFVKQVFAVNAEGP